jgi:soluble lytic murein transglycosylase-like protein
MSCLRISLAVLALCSPLACPADPGIYAFVDAEKGIHLSNVPGDGRYRVLIAPLVAAGEKPQARSAHSGNRQRYGTVIEQMAGRVGIDAALLHAVIAVESGYDANAVSARGAGGLMQLMPATAKRYGVADVFDPAENVRGGAQYLAELLALFENDLQLALAAYNAGESAVLKYGKRIPPYRETAAYVPKVVNIYRKLYRRHLWSM